MSASQQRAWNALIRTHHITSRKKVAKLRQAASNGNVFALLRSGGAPGIMYVEGAQSGVESWVAAVQRLRYKNFQLAVRPSEVCREGQIWHGAQTEVGLFEMDSVKDFAARMEGLGVLSWWRKGMGYTSDEARL